METDDPARGLLGRVVGIGASAGGVDALTRLFGRLDGDLPAAVLVVLHVPATGRSLLAPILDRRTALDVRVAEDGEALVPGTGLCRARGPAPGRRERPRPARARPEGERRPPGGRPDAPLARRVLRRSGGRRRALRRARRRQRGARGQARGRHGDRAGPRGRDGAEHARERPPSRRRRDAVLTADAIGPELASLAEEARDAAGYARGS